MTFATRQVYIVGLRLEFNWYIPVHFGILV